MQCSYGSCSSPHTRSRPSSSKNAPAPQQQQSLQAASTAAACIAAADCSQWALPAGRSAGQSAGAAVARRAAGSTAAQRVSTLQYSSRNPPCFCHHRCSSNNSCCCWSILVCSRGAGWQWQQCTAQQGSHWCWCCWLLTSKDGVICSSSLQLAGASATQQKVPGC